MAHKDHVEGRPAAAASATMLTRRRRPVSMRGPDGLDDFLNSDGQKWRASSPPSG
jgi:hypothetical protein